MPACSYWLIFIYSAYMWAYRLQAWKFQSKMTVHLVSATSPLLMSIVLCVYSDERGKTTPFLHKTLTSFLRVKPSLHHHHLAGQSLKTLALESESYIGNWLIARSQHVSLQELSQRELDYYGALRANCLGWCDLSHIKPDSYRRTKVSKLIAIIYRVLHTILFSDNFGPI